MGALPLIFHPDMNGLQWSDDDNYDVSIPYNHVCWHFQTGTYQNDKQNINKQNMYNNKKMMYIYAIGTLIVCISTFTIIYAIIE